LYHVLRATVTGIGVAVVWAIGGAQGSGGTMPTGRLPADGLGYVLVRTYQSSPLPPLGVLVDPVGISVAADGTVFVADRALHRAQRFTAAGEPLANYGRLGDAPGELYQPMAVAADPARDRVYVADHGNQRVAVYRLDGTFVQNWPGFVDPQAVAVHPDGWVYVSEPARATVTVMSAEHSDFPVSKVPLRGDERSLSRGASAIAVGPKGHLFVATSRGVDEYYPFGPYRRTVSLAAGAGAGATGVTFDGAGELYVLQQARLVIQRPGGLMLSLAIGNNVHAVAGADAGRLYFALGGTAARPGSVGVRQIDGVRQTPLARWGIPLAVLGWLDYPFRLAVGGDGDVYVVDEQRRVQRLSPDLAAALGQQVLPGLQEAVALPTGDLLVARTRYGSSDEDPDDEDAAPAGTRRVMIERYDVGGRLSSTAPAAGRRLWRWELMERITAAGATRIVGMDTDFARERLFVLDEGGARVLLLDAEGRSYPPWPLPRLDAGLPAYTDVAAAPDGDLFVLHSAARRVYRLAADGTPEGVWLTPEWPWRVAVGPDETVFVPTADRRVWAFSPQGSLQTVWALPPPRFDDPRPPSDIAVADDGRVYVLDHAGTAIYLYAPTTGGPVDRPPANSLRCDVQGRVAVSPAEVLVGDPAEVTLALEGTCRPHRRTGEVPGILLRTATVSVTLPAGVELVPGSSRPPATVRGQSLSWDLTEVPSTGFTLRYGVTARQSSRFTVFAQAGARYLDGWFGSGETSPAPVFFYTLLRPTPVPSPTAWWQARRAFLPAAQR
jgi:DNA-binding beta-propeller fold protein YncE